MSLEEDKISLIELIEWYRDDYHKKDFGHTQMIQEIRTIDNVKNLEPYNQVLDQWLDFE